MMSSSNVAGVNLSAFSPLLKFHPHHSFTGSKVSYFYFLWGGIVRRKEPSTKGTHCTLEFQQNLHIKWISVVQQ